LWARRASRKATTAARRSSGPRRGREVMGES
jgi:hypothetical protein